MRIYNAIIIEDGEVMSVKSFTDRDKAMEIVIGEIERVTHDSDRYPGLELHPYQKNEHQREIFGEQYAEKVGASWETGCQWGSAEVVWTDVEI